MRPLAIPAVLLLLRASVFGQSTAPVDANAMLAGLRDLKGKQVKSANAQVSQSVGDFSNAASSDATALAFYIEAIRATEFVGRPHEQTAFHDWKKKEAGNLKGPAIRTCLRYMVLSLQRAAGATDQQIFPSLLAYAQDTQALLASISDQDIATENVSGNVFARWYELGHQLSSLENWESSPANVEGIYKKVLLPFMRKNRDPAIIQYWDRKIAEETNQASSAAAAFTTDHFNQSRRPELLWSRAEDTIAIGLRDQGLTAMYAIVKNFPAHPSAGKWIDELQGLLTPPATGGTSGNSK